MRVRDLCAFYVLHQRASGPVEWFCCAALTFVAFGLVLSVGRRMLYARCSDLASVHAPTTALLQVLIYVFDIESHERAKDMKNYTNCIEAIQTNSPDAKVR